MTKIDYRTLIAEALRATVVHSCTRFSWFGQQSPYLPRAVGQALTPANARGYLIYAMQMTFYMNFYCPGRAIPQRTGRSRIMVGMTPFIEQLSAANSGIGNWEGGWQLASIADNILVVRRGDLQLNVYKEDCLVNNDHLVPKGQVTLRFPKELLGISPGYYMALSNCEFSLKDRQSVVRLYWNLVAGGATDFIRCVTTMLNKAELPFRVKVLSDPTRYLRCDAGVLYFPKEHYSEFRRIVESVYPQFMGNLKPGVPVFTKFLAPGLGLAEDPGQEDSFGMHRCRLLAEAIVNSFEKGDHSFSRSMLAVEENLKQYGISLEKPFLNPGSDDKYEFMTSVEGRSKSKAGSQGHTDDSLLFLKAARELGNRLVKAAFWSEEGCNWLGGVPEGHIVLTKYSGVIYSSLGPDIYNGTSGIALFLAELYATCGDVRFYDTAVGAMRHALAQLKAVPKIERLSLYKGWLGIALAAARVGILTKMPNLLQEAKKIAEGFIQKKMNIQGLDVVSGSSGAILTLIVLAKIFSDASLLKVAEQFGEDLLQVADKTYDGYSWKSPSFSACRNLTGYAHGTSGIGHALLELFGTTADPKYLRGAEMAFRYEQHWFDAEKNNWPDFRNFGKRRPLRYSTYWCHGAPGIALSRLRAFEIHRDEAFLNEAIIALKTTCRAIEAELHSGSGNFSLCHGLAGNAEILLYGSQVTGKQFPNGYVIACDVGKAGILSYGEHDTQWPCGTASGESPGLMLGLAGIGLFYLRLYNPKIPSALLMTPQAF